MVRGIYRVHLKDRKRSKDLLLIFGLNKTMDLLTMASSVHLGGHVLRRGWSCVENDIRF